jgi:hypothetical protein
MDAGLDAVPDDVDTLKAALVAAQERAAEAEAEVATVRAQPSDDQVLIAQLKLQIEKLRRTIFGQRSERSQRLLDQLELQLEEAEASATEDELAVGMMAARTSSVTAFPQAIIAPAVPGTPAPRAGDRGRAHGLCLLRWHALVQAGRGRHRDARGHPPPVEGDPACPREVLLL